MNSHPTTISRRFSNCLLWMAALWPWLGGNLLADSASTKNVGPLPQPATVWGVKPARYGLEKPYFMVDNMSGMTQRSQTDSLQVTQIGGSAPANMLWPGEPATIVVQVVNKTGQPLRATGKIDIIQYGLLTSMEDMFQISLRKLADAGSVPVAVDIPAQGFQDLKLELPIPERFGAYALVLDLPGQERLLVASLVRTFKNPPLGDSYRLCMDINNVPALVRLGAAPNRVGFAFRSPGDADYESYYQQSVAKLREYKAAGLPVIVEFGHETPMEGKLQPLGRPRTFIEDRGGKAFNPGKYIGDIAWLPQYDADFKAWVKRVALEFGWPKGPVNGIKLWNEPWEGMSIACWGADIPRFREISVAMCEGVEEARREGGVQVMLGGCDSTANTFDKYFCDGKDDFLKRLDFVTIHYQGLSPVAGVKSWVHRKGPDGQPSRVKIWDTESWCANSDDRIAGTLAAMYAAGHDRLVGIHSQHVVASEREIEVRTATGTERRKITQAWPVAPAVGALQHFVGNREFDRILFPGLPWVFAFKGNPGKDGLIDADDGSLVIVGDITPVFGQGNVLFRNVRSQEDVAAVQPLYRQLAALPADALERVELERKLVLRAVYRGGTMVLADGGGRYGVFDEYGNPMPAKDGKLTVPISDRGYYLRANGQPGSFAELLQAVRQSRIEGFQPVHFIAHDLTRPLSDQSALRVDVVNSLNRPVTGVLHARLGKLQLRPLDKVTLAPHERRTLELRPEHAEAEPSNEYPLSLEFDAGADGLAFHHERMHVNFIARRTITVDGRLDDWQGVLPQTISSDGTINRTEAEVAWKPFEPFSKSAQKGLATAYLAHDDQYFYFAAKVADDTPDGGTMRFETRDDDSFFFPEKVWQTAKSGSSGELVEATWPAGVRRYSYAKNPYLPAGNSPNFDNIQIGFNAVPDEEKPWYSHPPGTFPGYAGYFCTDYEYALNQVAVAYGGGTEIWRLRHPKLPYKHFYPRQPKAPFEGPVREGKLVTRHEGRSRIIECAIPWAEIPHVKARRDAGQTLKFTFRVNDSAGVGCLELAKERSVSKQNNFALLVRWTEHWANEVEFGFEKTENGKASPAVSYTPGMWANISPKGAGGGSSVNVKDKFGCNDIRIDPSNPSTLYTCWDEQGLHKSTNGGATWQRIGPFDSPLHVRVNPINSNHLYMVQGVRGDTMGFWVSTNGGANWTRPAGFTNLANNIGVNSGDNRKWDYDLYDLAVDPTDFNHVLISWHTGWNGYEWPSSDHNVFVGDNWGAGVFETFDGGSSWTKINPAAGMRGVGNSIQMLYNPAKNQGMDRKTWLLGTQQSGLWRTTNGGSNWTQVSTIDMTHGGMQIHMTSDGTLYTGGSQGVMVSTDNGATWSVRNGGNGLDTIKGYFTVLSDGTRFYAQPGVWRGDAPSGVKWYTSTDGTSWSAFNDQTFNGGAYNGVYDAANGILYSANWGTGVWGLKVTSGGNNPPPPPVATVPAISSQPANATVTAGQTATFSVTASGSGSLSYQWQRSGSAISGAISASYTTAATTTSDGGATFRVVVTCSGGSTTSSSATLTVSTQPVQNPPPPTGGVTGSIDITSLATVWYEHDQNLGKGWVEVSTPLLNKVKELNGLGSESGDMRATSLTIAPNGDLLMSSNRGLFRSRDGGGTWSPIDGATKDSRASRNTGYPETSGSIMVDPEDSRRVAYLWFRGNSFYTDGSNWFRPKGPGTEYPGLDCASIDWTSATPQVFLGPRHGGGPLDITRDGGKTWESQDDKLNATGDAGPGSSDSMVCVVDSQTMLYNQGNDQLASRGRAKGLFRSTDQGRTWNKVAEGQELVSKHAVALRNGTVYFFADRNLWISRDKGATWTTRPIPKISAQPPQLFGDWTGGKIGGMLGKGHEGVIYSKDEGQNWTVLVEGANFPPKYQGTLYAARESGYIYNADACDYQYGGGIWAFDPSRNVIYASTWAGPVISKQLPGAAPGPAPAGESSKASINP